MLVVSRKDLEEQIVVELKTDIQRLNEVNLIGSQKEVELKKINRTFKKDIQSDFEKHPYLYKPSPEAKGDLFAIFGILYKALFKGGSENEEPARTISFNDFQELFETDPIINDTFLAEDLKVPVEVKNFFVDYLDSLAWDYKLLKKENRLELMQRLYDSSDHYLKTYTEGI